MPCLTRAQRHSRVPSVYWHATADGEWVSYQVGADASHPASGTFEGWRYNDGSTGPSVTPAAALGTAAAIPSTTATPSSAPGDVG